jgi:uncharacterized membrane protein YphA (DoxX/SURF4 family)
MHHLIAAAALLTFAVLPDLGLAHEAWVLTPEQIASWNARPRAEIFTRFTTTNLALLAFASAFLIFWVSLARSGARELFHDFQTRVYTHGGLAAFGVRIGVAFMLLMAGLGLSPRHGTVPMDAPTLVAPDLELRLVSGDWGWLAWVELGLAVALATGVYVRLAGFVLLVVDVLGLYLFGYAMWAYAGIVAGAAVYLLLQGGGAFALSLPVPRPFDRVAHWLAGQSRERAQFLLRMLVGANLVYLGLEYKFLQSNLALALIVLNDVPTFGMEPATFVFVMALVETLAGVLIMAGVLMRAMSLILFTCFLFLALTLGESVISHIIFYGLLFSFWINGGGHWRRPIATDPPGRILILGGGLGALHSALRLEKLLGPYTNVEVTLVHRESNLTFRPLLHEVVAGSVQPGNIVIPFKRIAPHTRFLQGNVDGIDPQAHRVSLTLVSGEHHALDYDRLILATDEETRASEINGLLEHRIPLVSVGDALCLRRHVLQSLWAASIKPQGEARDSLLTFMVIGGGVKGCSSAAALRTIIASAISCYPSLAQTSPRVLLIEAESRLIPQGPARMARLLRRQLCRLGVEVLLETPVREVGSEAVILSRGQRIPCKTVIETLSPPRISALQVHPRDPSDAYLHLRRESGVHEEIFHVPETVGTEGLSITPEITLGRQAAFNAWASLRGVGLRRRPRSAPILRMVPLGQGFGMVRFLGVDIGGALAESMFRLLCLSTLPGLESNLRLIHDWVLRVAFRHDISVLAPEWSYQPAPMHYQEGDTIIREGEPGQNAYILTSGQVAVFRRIEGELRRVAVLGAGDCFGEHALIDDEPRRITVTCETPVDVNVIPRELFPYARQVFQELGEASRSRRAKRNRTGGAATAVVAMDKAVSP